MIDNNVRVLGSTKSSDGSHEASFHRNGNNDIYLTCVCGFEEVVAKNTPVANDNTEFNMREVLKKHLA